MGTRTAEATNERLSAVIAELDALTQWAYDDSNHAYANGAAATGRDDLRRAEKLAEACELVAECIRDE